MPAMMNPVDEPVLQEVSHDSCPHFATRILIFDNPVEVFVCQLREKVAEISFDGAPGLNERIDRGIVVWFESWTTLRTSAPIKPAPFGAQNVNERVPD